MFGSVTRTKVRSPEAPSESAASSSSVPCCCISGINSRTTKGKVTNTVASTIPGNAKMMVMSWAASHGPSRPWRPNNNTNTRPAITGDTENGRSISAIRMVLPRNSNLVIAHAATTPNTRLSETEIAAVSTER